MTSDTARRHPAQVQAEEKYPFPPKSWPGDRSVIELHRADFIAGWEARGEITEDMVEAVARIIANAASDWLHNDCGRDDHAFGHSNWEAYAEDARAALSAALEGKSHDQ